MGALVGRDAERLDDVASHARASGSSNVATLAVDLGLADGPSLAWRRTLEALQTPPTHVVCCHGIGRHGTAEAVSLAEFDECFTVNVRSMFELLQLSIPGMRASGYGHFVVVSSVLGLGCSS